MSFIKALFPILILLSPSAKVWAESHHPRLSIQVEPGKNPWTHLKVNDDPERFQFAIVTDRTGGVRPGIFEDAVTKLNLLQPEFVMSVGDLIMGGITDTSEIDRQWDEFDGFVDELQMPFFYLPGNHDISNSVMAEKWKERHGRDYYHFVYRDVLFLCLNSEDPKSHIGPEQIEYFRKALAENQDVRWTLAFLHRPLWTEDEDNGWKGIENLLVGRKHTVIAGHWHTYVAYERNDTDYIVLATCGGGSGMRGPLFGEFDHVVWVTMTEQGPLLANLMLEGIWDKNIRTEEMAEAVERAVQGRIVGEGTILQEDPMFLEATANLRVENTADVPMKVQADFRTHSHLKPTPATFERTIPPNSFEVVPVHLSSKEPIPVWKIPPMFLDWSVVYQYPQFRPTEIAASTPILIDSPFPIPTAANPVEVDGDLDDWQELPFACGTPAQLSREDQWQGPIDGSFVFGVLADNDFVYVGTEVQDDFLWETAGPNEANLADQDGVTIDIAGLESDTPISIQVAAPSREADRIPLRSVPPEARIATQRNHRGYSVEAAIPWSLLKANGIGSVEKIRLNIAQRDRDEKGRTATLWWRPSWQEVPNNQRLGTFKRNPE